MWYPFDRWLIGKFEAFAHWFQRLTGRTNWFLALCAICISNATFLYFFWKIGDLAIALILGVLSFLDVLAVSSFEMDAARRLEKGLANPRKSFFGATMRLFFVAFIGWLFVPFWFRRFDVDQMTVAFALCFFFLYQYFSACDPLPPGTSKIREWLESFGRKLATVSSRA